MQIGILPSQATRFPLEFDVYLVQSARFITHDEANLSNGRGVP
jgi:hypothetical protein